MKTKILPFVLIILIVGLSGCIQSDIGKINGFSSTINDHLKKGDNYYNSAAQDINKFSFDSALTNCNNAVSEFSSAKSSAEEGFKYAQNTKDTVFIQYMEYNLAEIDNRLNATSELKEAIPYLQQKNNSTGNPHITSANQFMDKSMEYKTKKDNLVKQNPSKFKQ